MVQVARRVARWFPLGSAMPCFVSFGLFVVRQVPPAKGKQRQEGKENTLGALLGFAIIL